MELRGIVTTTDPFMCFCHRYSLATEKGTSTAITPGLPITTHTVDQCRVVQRERA